MLHKEPDGSYKVPRIIYADASAERWLFFAQARHTVTLYYGASAV